MRLARTGALAVAAGLAFGAQDARAYNTDCAIMLCMAGGFPSSAVCSAAYAEMIRRITPWPSRPPFGVCMYAAVPVAPGGSGDTQHLETASPEFDWLKDTHVIWWRMSRNREPEGGLLFDWTARSCTVQNTKCQSLEVVVGSETPPSGEFLSRNGQRIPKPTSEFSNRGVMVEYSTFNGRMNHSSWTNY